MSRFSTSKWRFFTSQSQFDHIAVSTDDIDVEIFHNAVSIAGIDVQILHVSVSIGGIEIEILHIPVSIGDIEIEILHVAVSIDGIEVEVLHAAVSIDHIAVEILHRNPQPAASFRFLREPGHHIPDIPDLTCEDCTRLSPPSTPAEANP
jgi:hypothetical protein